MQSRKNIRWMSMLAISLFLFIKLSNVSMAQTYESYDITTVTDITSEELQEYAPDWCKPYCDLIVELSNEYGISSEFAISVFRYEYVPDMNSVGGWTNDNQYNEYESIEDSIISWFENMNETYCNEDSWHYNQTDGTEIIDIAPLYNQGKTEYDENSLRWKDTIENETINIIKGCDKSES